MEENQLYPIFLKLDQIQVLIVGGGKVAHEKLHFLHKSSPNANITLVAKEYDFETIDLAKKHGATLLHGAFEINDLDFKQMVISATNDPQVNRMVYELCKQKGILVNVADNPPLCDFFMGGIVNKGHVKIAISTNGKSPTTAKRLRQFFEAVIPSNISEMVVQLNTYRDRLKGDFENKVDVMNRLTKSLIEQPR